MFYTDSLDIVDYNYLAIGRSLINAYSLTILNGKATRSYLKSAVLLGYIPVTVSRS